MSNQPIDALDDPEYRKQVQGLKDVTAALKGEPSSPVIFSTDAESVLNRKMVTRQENYPDPDSLAAVVIGNEYEFYAEMQQAQLPVHERMRNYTSQKVTVIAGPLPKDPETSDLFIVRAADGRKFEAYEEELNGWDKALGQYFWPDGAFGPERDLQFLCNEGKSLDTERARA